jgi:hypothetical protein
MFFRGTSVFRKLLVECRERVFAIERGYTNEEIAALLTSDAQRFRLGGNLGGGLGLDFSRKSNGTAKRESEYKKEFFHG